MSQPETHPQPRTYRCRHLRTDGRQCNSPSLRQEHFCYYHHTTRVPAPPLPAHRQVTDSPFDLPLPEDRTAITHAIGEVLRRLAAQQIDHPTAKLLLYGLSVAAHNLTRQEKAEEKSQQKSATHETQQAPITDPVVDLVMDPHDGPLAPAAPGEPCRTGQRSITPGNLHLEIRDAQQRKTDAAYALIDAENHAHLARRQAIRNARQATPPEPTHPELERLLNLYTPQPNPLL